VEEGKMDNRGGDGVAGKFSCEINLTLHRLVSGKVYRVLTAEVTFCNLYLAVIGRAVEKELGTRRCCIFAILYGFMQER
jgi:hypothetical protein